MEKQKKYNRTFHYPFSPGTTSDDRINIDYWQDIKAISGLVHTEKLDGENNCLNRFGVFARSHAAPTVSPWTHKIRQRWQLMKNDLGDIELFGENLYAIHSIEYKSLEQDFYLFAVRCKDMWLSWDQVQFYASLFDFPCVPEISIQTDFQYEKEYRKAFLEHVNTRGQFAPHDVNTGLPCTLEGIVTRNAEEFTVDRFARNVFKYVRKNHVKTDQHWRVNWQRTRLAHEMKKESDHDLDVE